LQADTHTVELVYYRSGNVKGMVNVSTAYAQKHDVWGHYKTWTLDSGLDHGLDSGLNKGT